jgi:ribose/xylose/arabinose/galactoside ABC-type transport system permease subunit
MSARHVRILQQLPTLFFRYGTVAGLIILCLVFAVLTPEHTFISRQNLVNLANQIAVNCILAVGMTFVIITSGIDLSVGSILALAGVLCAYVIKRGVNVIAFGHEGTLIPLLDSPGAMVAIAIPVCLVISGLMGAASGGLISRFTLPPFMARGAAFVACQGRPIGELPEAFTILGVAPGLAVPIPIYIMAGVVAVAWVLLMRTAFGRAVFAIGGNESAAWLSGINVGRVKVAVYGMSGLLAGLGGVVQAAKLMSGDPKEGQMFELDAIAAVVVGGTSLMGGRGSISGTVIGALIIGVMNNGLSHMHVDQYWQWIVKGLVILGAVLLDRFNRR